MCGGVKAVCHPNRPQARTTEQENALLSSMPHKVGLAVSMAMALMLAATLVWTTSARSETQNSYTDLQILGVNDFHGNLEPTIRSEQTLGGAAYLDAHLEQHAAEYPNATIRVHAGDMVGGSPLISSYFHDEPT